MNNFAYAKRQANDLTLHFYEDDTIPISSAAISGLMMCRLDFDIKILEIPPVSEDEITKLLNYRLRSIYPGDPEETLFDYRIINRNRKRYAILFITSRENREQYRLLAGRKPLFLPYTIVESHLKKQHQGENFIYFFWDHDWIDILIFEDKILVASTAVKREKEVFLDVMKIKNILPRGYTAYGCIFMGLAEDQQEIQAKSRDLFTGQEEVVYENIQKILLAYKKKSDALFRKKHRADNITKKLRVDVLLLPVILMLCLLFNKHVETRKDYRNMLVKTQSDKIQQSRLQLEYNKLQNDLNKLLAQRPMACYLLLSEVSEQMAGDAILYNFRMLSRDNSFLLEGEVRNALDYNDKFRGRFFHEVTMDEFKRDPKLNKDIFKLSGEFNANQ